MVFSSTKAGSRFCARTAISCSNSGLYGAARAMYSLARLDMAPHFLGEINKNGMPSKAIGLSK